VTVLVMGYKEYYLCSDLQTFLYTSYRKAVTCQRAHTAPYNARKVDTGVHAGTGTERLRK